VGPNTEVVKADLTNYESLLPALSGLSTVYYLVHSLGNSKNFEDEEEKTARNFAKAAVTSGVKKIIFLGGLGAESQDLSPHLRSRHRVGDLLRESGIPVIELRASIILGSGSLSYELVRSLVEVLPVMITPRWVAALAQPIGIADVLKYLVLSLEKEVSESVTYEIGGPDVVSYGDLMREYASQRHLKRHLIPVPFLTPYLSSLWLGLVTPLYARVGRKLIDSIRHDTVVKDPKALADFPFRPKGVPDAIAMALRNEDDEFARTRWSDSVSAGVGAPTWAGLRFGTRLVDSRTTFVRASPAAAFKPISRIGGKTGWYYGNWLWGLRGLIDLLFGGVGLKRGRMDPHSLNIGDVVDCWRVDDLESSKRLRLFAEMKLPGRAWLEFEVEPCEGGSTIRQTAIFDPLGLWGLSYWYAIYPLHQLVFRGMLKAIAREVVCES